MGTRTSIYIKLHLLLMMYSCVGVCSKLSSRYEFLSPEFLFLFGCVFFLLFLYALGWQWVLHKLPLGVAFSNKAVVILWVIILGNVIFDDVISWRIIVGAFFIIVGIVLLNKPAKKTPPQPDDLVS